MQVLSRWSILAAAVLIALDGARRRPRPVQDRHLGAGRDHLPGVDGASGRARCQGRAESRIHQHGRRQPRRAGAVVRRNPGHACRAGAGGAGQQAGRRPAAGHLDRQHHPDHDLRLAGNQDRGGPQGQDHRHQHVRLGNRRRGEHRAAAARPQTRRRHGVADRRLIAALRRADCRPHRRRAAARAHHHRGEAERLYAAARSRRRQHAVDL